MKERLHFAELPRHISAQCNSAPMLALVVFAVAAIKGSIFRSEGAEESTTA
jgi:hypothetical protein